MDNYKGFSLFTDIEDVALRTRNRAVILRNIAASHIKNRRISPGGASLILGYFNLVPAEERNDVQKQFINLMNADGYHFAY